MALASPAIDAVDPTAATFRLLHEWLSGWFNGQAHTLYAGTPGAQSVVFPNATIARTDGKHQSAIVFEDMPAAQPLADRAEGFEIRVVPQTRLERPGRIHGGHLVNTLLTLHFWVSAKKPGEGNSIRLARDIADKLHALLADPAARLDLALKGITHLQPQAPFSVSSNEYARRLVSCACGLRYTVPVAG